MSTSRTSDPGGAAAVEAAEETEEDGPEPSAEVSYIRRHFPRAQGEEIEADFIDLRRDGVQLDDGRTCY
jgi:hypothetical protein